MKRHFFRMTLALLLALACLVSFAACTEPTPSGGENQGNTDNNGTPDDNGTPEASVVTTVSASDWKKLFDIAALDSYTITYTAKNTKEQIIGAGPEMVAPNTEESPLQPEGSAPNAPLTIITNVTGSVRYTKGNLLTDVAVAINDEAYPSLLIYSETEVKSFMELDLFLEKHYDADCVLGIGYLLAHVMEPHEDYGYSLFTYSEETKAYVYDFPFEDQTVHTEIFVENGVLKKIIYGHEKSMVNMTVSDINATTVAAPMEKEAVAAALSITEQNLSVAQSATFHGKATLPILNITVPVNKEVELSEVTAAFRTAADRDVLAIGIVEGKLSHITLDAKDAEQKVNEYPVEYDTVTILLDEIGKTINIIYNEDFNYELTY